MQQCYIGNKINKIGQYIQEYVKHNKMWVVQEFVGHGIGQEFHEYPSIPHTLNEDMEFRVPLELGQTFSVEPIIALNKTRIKVKKDKWAVVGRDSPLAAQFEATVGINEEGVEVFCQ